METTRRFNEAVSKLYNAFHSQTLAPECCNHCAVGTILDNRDYWKHLSDFHGSLQLNYIGLVNQRLGKTFNGYSPKELLQIEYTFLKALGYNTPLAKGSSVKIHSTNNFFKALSAVVSLLCQLDNYEDIMNIESLLDYKPSKPLHKSVLH